MILGHKIELRPNKKQVLELVKAVGCARFAYNWGLEEWERQYKVGEKPTALKIKKKFNELKGQEYPWIYDSPKDSNQQALNNLGKAFDRFFKGLGGYPVNKKKFVNDSFYVPNDKLRIKGSAVRLPVLGWMGMRESLRFSGKIQSAVVSRKADRWYISFNVDMPGYKKERKGNNKVGVDLGIKTAVMTSEGKGYDAPKPLKKYLRKLKKLSRQHSRKVKGSANRKKSAAKLGKLHKKIADVRRDWVHKVTTALCQENQLIVLEDLNVAGMVKNHKLSRAIIDIGWGELRRQIEYKAQIYGDEVVLVDRWYASSKTCSGCGAVKEELLLSERVYECDKCGLVMDRDNNAAVNILRWGEYNNQLPEAIGEVTPVEIGAKLKLGMVEELRSFEAGTNSAHYCAPER